VDPTGKARDIRVVRSLGLGLDEKAIEAVNKWKFRPGVKNGQPVSVQATIEVNFRLL
jgi:periplasmic protein TonB